METIWLRRALLSAILITSAFFFTFMPQNQLFSAPSSSDHGKLLVYVGVYGKGVQAFRFDTKSAALEPLGLVGEVTNPSWLGTDRHYKNLYAVSELEGTDTGSVASFSIDRKSGQLHPLNHVGSGGVAPCYLALDATGKTLVAANYSSGGVSAFPVKPDGSLGEMSSLMTAEGASINKERQEGPHAHEAVISGDNGFVYVPDLGLDKIRVYRLDPVSSKLVPNDPPFVQVEAGHGPRHIIFDKQAKYGYVINELKPLVSAFSRDPSNGHLKLIQTVATISAGFTKENTGAEIRLSPSGKFLYTSNRGEDTIQVFAINAADGMLKQVQSISTQGEEPRGFAFDPSGHWLLVGNQKSNKLVVFKADANTGHLSPAGQTAEVPSPADVLFVPAT